MTNRKGGQASGLTNYELIEAITHMACYAGCPNATTAITTLRNIVEHAEQSPTDR